MEKADDAPWLRDLFAGDVTALGRSFPFAAAMRATPQDPVHHAEGDVWTHTGMVMTEAMRIAEARGVAGSWRGATLMMAALIHDCAKPETTEIFWCEKEGRERVRQPNHAAIGADKGWRLLLDADAPLMMAREACEMTAWHQRPGHMLDERGTDGRIAQYAVTGNSWSGLLDLCRADQLGRICGDTPDVLAALDLIEEAARGLGERLGADLLGGDPDFWTAESRVRIGEDRKVSAFHEHRDPEGPLLIVTSGLPGSGKSTWRRERAERTGAVVISMDEIRRGIKGWRDTDEQRGRVRQEASAALREALARGEREIVWDATSLTRDSRARVLRVGRDYGARTAIVSFDVPAGVAGARNRARDEEDRVPEAVMARMAGSRQMTRAHEAHDVISVSPEGREVTLHGEPLPGEAAVPAPSP